MTNFGQWLARHPAFSLLQRAFRQLLIDAEMCRAIHLTRLVAFKKNAYDASATYLTIRHAARPDFAQFDRALQSMSNYVNTTGDYIRVSEISSALVSTVFSSSIALTHFCFF